MIILLVLLLVVIIFGEIRKFRVSNILASPFLLISVIILVIFVLPGTITIGSTSSIIFSGGVLTLFALWLVLKNRSYKYPMRGLSSRSFFLIISFGSLVFLTAQIFEVIVVLNKFGIDGLFSRDRLGLYLSDSSLKGGAVPTFIKVVSEPFFYLYLSIIYGKRKKRRFYLLFVVYIFTILVNANTRLAVILPLLALFLFLSYVKKMSLLRVLFISSFCAVGIGYYLYYANVVRSGLSGQVKNVDKLLIAETLIDELDYAKYLDNVGDYAHQSGHEMGYGWFLGSIANLIPRSVWDEKPITSTSNRFTLNFTKKGIGVFNPVMTITIFGEGYLQLGYLGVCIELALFMIVFTYLFYYFITNTAYNSVLLGFHLLTVFGIYFRAEIPWMHIFIYIFITTISRHEKSIPDKSLRRLT